MDSDNYSLKMEAITLALLPTALPMAKAALSSVEVATIKGKFATT